MKKRIIALVLILSIVLAVAGCSRSAGNSKLTVTFIDVGQGDAALVECGGESMLIDTGPNNKTTGEKIRKLLLDKGIYTLKYLVISHLHDDHYGGLLNNALQNVEIKATLCNEDPYRKSNVASHLDGSQLIIPKAGEEFSLGSATIRVVDVNSNQANDSLVLLINYENTNFLFTGDIEKEAEQQLIQQASKNLESTILKVAHHGSNSSTISDFVKAVSPKVAVIGVGENNKFGHPNNEIISRLEKSGAKIFRTDQMGEIIIKIDNNGLMKIKYLINKKNITNDNP